MRRIAIAPLIAAVALVGGLVVGSAPAGASVPVKNNSCKVLKGSDVTKVTGFTASKAITRPGPPRAAICGYSLADPATTRDVSVFVLPHGAQEAKIGYRTAKKAFKDQIEPVSGFGKNAFYAGAVSTRCTCSRATRCSTCSTWRSQKAKRRASRPPWRR